VATLVIGVLGVVLIAVSPAMPSVKAILDSSVNAIGFHICFYMGLVGFACAWQHRREFSLAPNRFMNTASSIVWPLLSASAMVYLGAALLPTFETLTSIIAIGGLVVGVIPWGLNRWRSTIQ
jgi:hypothetical protein